MKNLGVSICLLATFLLVSPAKSAVGAIGGFDMLRQLFFLNRIEAEGNAGKKSDSASGGKDEESRSQRESRRSRSGGKAHFSTALLTSGAETAELTVEIGFANFTMEAAEGDTLIHVEVEYMPEESQTPVMDYHRENGHVVISLESSAASHESDLDVLNANESTWHVRLGRDVTWSLSLDLGYCDNSIELGGLKVEALSIESGLSETVLSFSEPNIVILEKCAIESGLGSFEAMRLGNAAMRSFTLENGLGSSLLDFSGMALQENLDANIESGLGSVKMRLPDGLPVLMQVESSLGSADLPRFKQINDGLYRSIPYMEGAPGLKADVSVGMGSITVIWVTKEKHWRQ
jgi:hypothetical protein